VERIKNPRIYLSLIAVVIIISLCILKGLGRIYLSDFYPINGDFQNYNGFRRLLDGQIPFEDFYFYLGLGPLYINALLIWIIGNDFTNSLFVTNFLTSFMFALSAFIIFYLNGLRINLSLVFTIIILMVALRYFDFVPPMFFKNFPFFDMISPGNSLRMQRAFLPYLVTLLLLLCWKANLHKKVKNESYQILLHGMIIGIGLVWSNDYGISVIVSSLYIFIIRYFQFTLAFVKKLCLFLFGEILGALGLINLLTRGNPLNWFDYNFLGVAKDQFWYYNTKHSDKILTLYEFPINTELIIGFLFILYLSWKIRKGKHSLLDILFLFIILSAIIAGYAYAVSSVKIGMFEPFYFIFYLSLISLICKYASKSLININTAWSVIVTIIIFTSAILFVYPKAEKVMSDLESERGIKIEGLGGYLSQYGNTLNLVSKKISPNEEIFSTYASALEVIENKYQPSGIDYIIHVLGNQYRQAYLASFHKNAPDYITTIREDFTSWEIWAKRTNWFFYREFLKSYEPISVTDYNVIWKKTDKDLTIDSKIKEVQLKRLSANSWEIHVKTDPKIGNAIADISINYSSSWNKKRISGLGIRNIIEVVDGWELPYSIPNNQLNYCIPIRIINGEGKSVITSYPSKLTNINLQFVQFNKIYIDTVDYKAIGESMSSTD
jgi:hypothetical protein